MQLHKLHDKIRAASCNEPYLAFLALEDQSGNRLKTVIANLSKVFRYTSSQCEHSL